MAQRRAAISDGSFRGVSGASLDSGMGRAIGDIFARFVGAGRIAGAALGALVLTLAGLMPGRSAEAAGANAYLEGFGRATRDDRVGRARLLETGGETAFSPEFNQREPR
jgi:hypothetical protein